MFATDTCRGGVEHAATAIGHICRHVVDALGTTCCPYMSFNLPVDDCVRQPFCPVPLKAVQKPYALATKVQLVTSEESLERSDSSLFTNAQPPVGPEA